MLPLEERVEIEAIKKLRVDFPRPKRAFHGPRDL